MPISHEQPLSTPRSESRDPDGGEGARFRWHGGALAEATRLFGDPGPEGWLDLSTGIAPVSYPLGKLNTRAWTALPDGTAEAALLSTVRRIHGIPEAARVLPVAGEQAALQWLPLCLGWGPEKGSVVVPEPGYGGHAEAWRAAGFTVEAMWDPLDAAGRAPVLVVINPNNPDGRLWSMERLLAAVERQRSIGGLLIVDEAFGEVSPDFGLSPWTGAPGLLVLRSLGKFFGLPGARLGWLAGEDGLLDRLARRMGPWSVSGPALEIGARAEADAEWRQVQRRRLRRRAATLRRGLQELDWRVIGGTDLFVLVEVPSDPMGGAARWFDGLARQGILTRPFQDHPRWLRLGLPPNRAGEARLFRGITHLSKEIRSGN